jgi:cell division protein FtsW
LSVIYWFCCGGILRKQLFSILIPSPLFFISLAACRFSLAFVISFFVMLGLIGLAGIVGLIIVAPYRVARILAYLNPWSDPLGSGFQIIQSLYAIGPGGLFGLGLGNSIQKHFYLPEPQTDFIFAIVGEEFGFLGTCAIIILILLIVLECINVARKAKDLAGTLIATGVAALIGFQSFLNISVATGVMPNTGIPLPFVSYGLSSLLSLYISIGMVLNVRLQGNTRKQATNQRGLEL